MSKCNYIYYYYFRRKYSVKRRIPLYLLIKWHKPVLTGLNHGPLRTIFEPSVPRVFTVSEIPTWFVPRKNKILRFSKRQTLFSRSNPKSLFSGTKVSFLSSSNSQKVRSLFIWSVYILPVGYLFDSTLFHIVISPLETSRVMVNMWCHRKNVYCT